MSAAPPVAQTKIKRAVLYPATGEAIEIPGPRVVAFTLQGGTVHIRESLEAGGIRDWLNVPCMIEHAPSAIVRPTVLYTGPGAA